MPETNKPNFIVAFVADIYFVVQIEKTAEALDFQIEWIERETEGDHSQADLPARRPGERLHGPGADMLERLTLIQPALLIFDLGNRAIPWREWIALIKSAAATRRIPVLCFGSHVDTDTFAAAKSAGADVVVARSRFTSALPELIARYARVPDYEAIESACSQEASELAKKGYAEYDRGEFFEAHETLEDAWNEDQSESREVYRAILQVAVCYLQIQRGNYRGAKKMILRVRQWLRPLPDECRGVDIAALKEDVRRIAAALDDIDEDSIDQFDHALFKPLKYLNQPNDNHTT